MDFLFSVEAGLAVFGLDDMKEWPDDAGNVLARETLVGRKAWFVVGVSSLGSIANSWRR